MSQTNLFKYLKLLVILMFAFSVVQCSSTADTLDSGSDPSIISGCEDGDEETVYEDNDEDGFGNPDEEKTVTDCNVPDGYADNNDDCDDDDDDINPDADEEAGDGIDNDCDGEEDNDGCDTYYADEDGDGYGDADNPTYFCDGDEPSSSEEDELSTNDDDCDDSDDSVNPDATDVVTDDVDNDCSGEANYLTNQVQYKYKSEYEENGSDNELKTKKSTTYKNVDGFVEEHYMDEDGDEDYDLHATYDYSDDNSFVIELSNIESGDCETRQSISHDDDGILEYWYRDIDEAGCDGYEIEKTYDVTTDDDGNLSTRDVKEVDGEDEVEFTEAYTYTYHDNDEVKTSTVTKDGEDYKYYEYDEDGNKTLFRSDGDEDGVYDQETVFAYDSNGFLETATFYSDFTSGELTDGASAAKTTTYTNDNYGSPTLEVVVMGESTVKNTYVYENSYNE
jgi:hypothetical protein